MTPTTRRLRVATYHRVSTLDGRQDAALAREELRAAAERIGAVAMEIEEQGSGARNDRPGLQRVMDEARRGRLDAVVVWKLDRWGRSASDVSTNIKDLQARGVRFVAVTQNIDVRPGGDAVSMLTVNILAAVAEFERELIRERVTLGLRRAAKKGTRSGNPIGRPRKGAAPDPAKVHAMRTKGASWSQVAGALKCTVASARRAAA
jgi:DNA invertase Pin-like site-specific DNA recombinase